MPNKNFWRKQSFTRSEMEQEGFPALPFRREDLNETQAGQLTNFYTERAAGVELEAALVEAARKRAIREARAERWLERFQNIWAVWIDRK